MLVTLKLASHSVILCADWQKKSPGVSGAVIALFADLLQLAYEIADIWHEVGYFCQPSYLP